MEIGQLGLTQLKGLAYDESRKLTVAQNNLKIINDRISQLENAPDAEPVDEVPEETE